MRRSKTSQFGSYRSHFASVAVNTNPAALETPTLMANPERPEAVGWFNGYSGQSFSGQPYAGCMPRSGVIIGQVDDESEAGYLGEDEDCLQLKALLKKIHRGWHQDESAPPQATLRGRAVEEGASGMVIGNVGMRRKSLHKYGIANISDPTMLTSPQAFFGDNLMDPHDVAYGVGQLDARFYGRYDANPLKVGAYGARVSRALLEEVRDGFPNMNYGSASTLEYLNEETGIGDVDPDAAEPSMSTAENAFVNEFFGIEQGELKTERGRARFTRETRIQFQKSRAAMREAQKLDRQGDREAAKILRAGDDGKPGFSQGQRAMFRAQRQAMREADRLDRQGDREARRVLQERSSGVETGLVAIGNVEVGLFGSKKRKAKKLAALQAQAESGAVARGGLAGAKAAAQRMVATYGGRMGAVVDPVADPRSERKIRGYWFSPADQRQYLWFRYDIVADELGVRAWVPTERAQTDPNPSMPNIVYFVP